MLEEVGLQKKMSAPLYPQTLRRDAPTPSTLLARRPDRAPAQYVAKGHKWTFSSSERRAIASHNAGEGDVLDERLERNRHLRNIAFAVGGK
jgi:hypothetical protein